MIPIKSSNWEEALKKENYPPDDELYKIFTKKIEFPYKIFMGKHAGLIKYKSCSPGSAKINGDLIRQEMGSRIIKVKDSIYHYHWTTGNYLEFNDEFIEKIMPWILDLIKEEEARRHNPEWKSDLEEIEYVVQEKFPAPVIDDPDYVEASDQRVIKHFRNMSHFSKTGEFLDEEYMKPCC
ncbi:uncharacterized protein KGF55_005280 [Candida pseudojiufengensis]|uniref:uncharacterized protein n=1 Tax=Candida pseudojiufengensis TaxID=497109 RepID=UPI0022256F00|nr:uncharacterized protein KGF55_005280 [Candida pseudojiufengensis]KAI5959636.1 hypothetical protein KGF55_005280 [Candida pseudojiufengensis]